MGVAKVVSVPMVSLAGSDGAGVVWVEEWTTSLGAMCGAGVEYREACKGSGSDG